MSIKMLCVAAITTALSPAVHAQEVQCKMTLAFEQPDVEAPENSTPVWIDTAGNLMFLSPLQVNTDGTRRSYKVDDFWGKKDALNNVCNAMKDGCDRLSGAEMKQRRIATQEARKKGWPADLLTKTRLAPHIIPMRNGKPCPEVDGYLVSSTALRRNSVKDACDLSKYLDALTVPSIVLPKPTKERPSKFEDRKARVGDLAIALLASAEFSVPGVVGDLGPWNKLGEASLAMNGRLLKKTMEPINYQQVRGLDPYEGQGWATPKAFVLIFSQSRDLENPYMTRERIDPEASRRFAEWGGLARAKSCINAHGRSKN